MQLHDILFKPLDGVTQESIGIGLLPRGHLCV